MKERVKEGEHDDWFCRETWVDVTTKAIRDHEAACSWGGNDPAHSDKYHHQMAERIIDALTEQMFGEVKSA